MNITSIPSTVDSSVFTAEASGITFGPAFCFSIIVAMICISIFLFMSDNKHVIRLGQSFLIGAPIVGVACFTLITVNDNHPSAISVKADHAVQEIAKEKYNVTFDDEEVLNLTSYEDGIQLNSDVLSVFDSEGNASKVTLEFTENRDSVILNELVAKEIPKVSK